ncbi:hypothetical protein PF005_g31037 [Phytophthora fragariae]|uniref:Uncharacterized protein n=2 Tax=Phytophthora fragariae TaxID=53985 RepID=A0A6A3V6S8_9STRA|nr:hypothetical protein PF010_g29441 [Phytophthora fragariae]KAE9161972.1 hypothetical protein PF005_g31037 [Phytophthora fragariae]
MCRLSLSKRGHPGHDNMSTTPTISPQKRDRFKKLQPNKQPRRIINVNDEEETKAAEPMTPAPRASRQGSDHSDRIIKNNRNANTAYNWFREDNE